MKAKITNNGFWIPRLLRVYRRAMHYTLYLLFFVSGIAILLYLYLNRNNAFSGYSLLQITQGHENEVMITDWKGNPARLMTYKKYCIIAHFLESKMSKSLDNYERITLVLHMTYNYFDERITDQVAGWEGPISMSIFLPSDILKSQIDELRKKIIRYESDIRSQLSVHLFYQTDQNGLCNQTLPNSSDFIKDTQKQAKKEETNRAIIPYPINVARNIARMLSRSKYILLSDYEFIFSYGFETAMLELAQKHLSEDPKAVLVFRIFEALGNMSTLPRDKKTLHERYKNHTAIEFHTHYAGRAHVITGLNYWFAYNATDGRPSIDRMIPYKRADWEPAFVSLTTIPFHDENFPYPVRDNTVLRWEMCRMNYTFLLVHDHFMVHAGVKTRGDSSLRRSAMKQFRSASAQFRKRMDQLYPETNATCPKLRS